MLVSDDSLGATVVTCLSLTRNILLSLFLYYSLFLSSYIIFEQRLLQLFHIFLSAFKKKAYIMIIINAISSYFQGLGPLGPFRSQYNTEIPSSGALLSFFLPFAFHNKKLGRVHDTNVLLWLSMFLKSGCFLSSFKISSYILW